MKQATRIYRLSMLAIGLSIGAALAATPGVASADSFAEPFSWIDQLLGGLSDPAQITSALDMQVSISGMDVFPTADNTATATSGLGDIAIAIGNGATAEATGGALLLAVADGTDSTAGAGLGGVLDLVTAVGTGSEARPESAAV
jgi:hypothetical protein